MSTSDDGVRARRVVASLAGGAPFVVAVTREDGEVLHFGVDSLAFLAQVLKDLRPREGARLDVGGVDDREGEHLLGALAAFLREDPPLVH